jgi:hypothetical protein
MFSNWDRNSDFNHKVDRDVPIAIYFLTYRAGTARSTLPEVLSIS